MTDGRVLMERDDSSGIARITLDNPERKNAYDPAMRQQLGRVPRRARLRRRHQGRGAPRRGRCVQHRRRHEQRLRLVRRRREGRPRERRQATSAEPAPPRCWSTARRSTSTSPSSATRRSPWPRSRASPSAAASSWRSWPTSPSWPSDTMLGMPATRFLGPALGSLHLFFHRLGPVLARRLLLTGDTIEAGEIAHLGRVHRGRRARRGRRPGRRGGPRRRRGCRPTGS